MNLPRLVVAAPSSSAGKTTIAVGLMAALRSRGVAVAPFKTGPDYIDPGYHTLAAGRVGRNLDPHLCGPELIAPLLAHGFRTPEVTEIAVVEGAMGLFDGSLSVPEVGRAGFGSAAHVATLTGSPVLLVVDAAKSSRTVAAVTHGMASYDPDVRVAGVLLNKIGSQRNVDACTRAVEELGLPVLGAIPRASELTTPSRHLGLVPAAERDQARAMVQHAGELVAAHVDLDRVLELAGGAGELDVPPWQPSRLVSAVSGRPRIAVAAGRAFTFRYPETVELLTAAGCEVTEFDPLTDATLPDGTAGLYLGGGFPEVYARELAGNAALRSQIRRLVLAGLPTVAECAGLLYLCDSLDGQEMAGALPLAAAMTPRLTLGYRHCRATVDSLLTRRDDVLASHEFHRTGIELASLAGDHRFEVAWDVDGRAEGVSGDPAGLGRPTVHASYQHLHWAGYPLAAQRFAEAAARWAAAQEVDPPAPLSAADVGGGARGEDEQRQTRVSTTMPDGGGLAPASRAASLTATPPPTSPHHPDLTHHGDRDLAPGLTDLAVNVHAATPPGWLADRLTSRREAWAPYPDAGEAREALAARHGVDPRMVLPTAGAAEAFGLVARAFGTRCALVVHPQFTEPEQALRLAGHLPRRLLLRPETGFTLDPADVDDDADLVVVGNPTNPTSVLHSAESLRRLARPGRVLLVDEAFMDAVPGEPESLIGKQMSGILVTRSLTKTWSLAGIRAGYVVGDPGLVRTLARLQTPWSVATPALDAMVACSAPQALAEADQISRTAQTHREAMVRALTAAGLAPVDAPRAPFVLVDCAPLGPRAGLPGWIREQMAGLGFAVRRGESFPGLGPSWIRLAVRDQQTSRRAVEALASLRHHQ
ncbi:cobyrinate a,c-diamide synthase [Luteococcus sp. H154]|uniref:cobyrinate a,c-diamide synthase n=1 Tax=Luteococcus sp. H101 TaxID=3139402 RepID=UPI00313D2096